VIFCFLEDKSVCDKYLFFDTQTPKQKETKGSKVSAPQGHLYLDFFVARRSVKRNPACRFTLCVSKYLCIAFCVSGEKQRKTLTLFYQSRFARETRNTLK
jgi:hypothetical protein